MVVDKKRLFISYAQEDKAFAEQLHEHLQKYGLDVWLDITDVPHGADWAKLVAQEISRSDGLLLIMSPDSQASTNVEVEWQQMLSRGKPVFPLLYRPLSGGFHSAIDKLNYLDVSNQSEAFVFKFQRILESLEAQGFINDPELGSSGAALSRPIEPPMVVVITLLALYLILRVFFGIDLVSIRPANITQIPSQTVSPTPTPTHTPGSDVAFLPVRILSLSGIEIGNGTVRIFAPTNIRSTDSTLIELELNLDQRYITPTPFGPITPIPVTRIASTPRPSHATPTPRVPAFEESGITAFQRMGATLYCPQDRFTGCDQESDVTEARLIDWNTGGQWSWIIAPVDGVRGLQNLRVELWTIKQVNDGPEQADPIWDHSFQIEVLAQSEPFDFSRIIQDNIGTVLTVCGGVVVALIGAGYFSSRQSTKRSTQKTSKAKTVAKTKVFISYRRVGGTSTAQTIKERLERKGADVFLDVHDITTGRFDEIISKAIVDCNYFVLILAPGTLKSEWVVKEVEHAIKTERTIIPVLVDGYRFETHPTPARLAAIEKHNGVTLSPEFFDEAIEKLAKFVGLP